MDMEQITGMTHQELVKCINHKKNEILWKLQNEETESSFSIGAGSFTVKEWDKLLSKVDQNNEAVRKEQEKRKEALEKEALEKKEAEKKMFISILESGDVKRNYFMEKINNTYQPSCPYEYLAKNGVISYKGVEFVCDTERNAICLGDMTNKDDVLTIPLEGGGSLMVNRNSIGLLAEAITMFSPEDMNRIMRAIADDKKVQEMQQEIDEDTNSIGDDANEKIFEFIEN
ncbi:hypothetical protein IMSAGC011_03056 [Lachnospiraceae bacterium]|nr:hypothetical protein IMSAGC011_03056 [Lachnospiraceae bacterium]